jgi:dUTP pyrophosphatase
MELPVHRLHPDAKLPEYAHDDDAGMDIFAYEETVVPARGRAAVSTGIAMAIPNGFVGLFWDKSGLATNHGLTILGGVIDAGYRGELRVTIANTSDTEHIFAKGDKVTQMLIQKVEHPTLIDTDHLPESERGAGGFGSTGK